MTDKKIIPNHIAIIMDGNGRWAKKRLMPRIAGHRAGSEAVERTIKAAMESGVKILTLFAFSSENWLRPQDEVNHLMDMFLKGLERDAPKMIQKGIRLRFIGNLEQLNAILREKIKQVEEQSKTNDVLQLVIAVNYGGQWDLLNAAKKMHEDTLAGKINCADWTTHTFTGYLSTQELPSPDLFIRTSGEIRISNFLLWQLAYTELYFTDVLWPDFDEKEFAKALIEFSKRQRRYGKV